MTTSNEIKNAIVTDTVALDKRPAAVSVQEQIDTVPEELAVSIPEAVKAVHEARRVEAEAKAIIVEAHEYERDMLRKLQAAIAPPAAGIAEPAPDDSEQGDPIAAGYMAEAAYEQACQPVHAGKHNFATIFKEPKNMTNESAAKSALVDQIMAGPAGIKAAEAAIQSALEAFMNAAASEVSILVKNNTLYPEIREDMLKLEKRVMEMTLEAIASIQARVPEPPKPKTKDNS